ncbi:hypothetical protein SAMN05660461_4681 [Chitinophaga ginsengisegetis]|uniref:Uncharacterized protein n=1 Tax=Chitinophaga ginsengisegetis TaxID=393003 RepID=A0A1T5P7R6_9BACT|nr:hypothetical protein [Chitinophaga ginsengisegetis]SKD08804.1 hypothetical protein SAMN05660461_4681 [Chitinophaga ginsengisegetis]
MLPNEEEFPPLYSTSATRQTVVLKVFLLGCFAVVLAMLLAGVVFSFWIKEVSIRMLTMGIAAPVLCGLIWMAVASYRSGKPKYTRAEVNAEGLHQYGEGVPVLSLRYEALSTNSSGGVYDVLWTDLGYSETNPDLYVFIKNESGAVQLQAVQFRIFLVPNGNALLAHFVRGIMRFRPDLKIDPKVLSRYRIT